MNNVDNANHSDERKRKTDVPLWEKLTLSIPEAAEYSGIGQHRLRALVAEPDCTFAITIGPGKTRIKRKQFERYLDRVRIL